MTRLADANSPADLAALVAEASGLGGCMCSVDAWEWLCLLAAAVQYEGGSEAVHA